MDYNNYLNRDYKLSPEASEKRMPRIHRGHIHLLLLVSVLLGTIALLVPGQQAEATRHASPTLSTVEASQQSTLDLEQFQNLPLPLPHKEEQHQSAPIGQQEPVHWQNVLVKEGDTLSSIFERLKLTPQQLHALLRADGEAHYLDRLRPAQSIRVQIVDGELKALQYQISETKTLLFHRSEEEFSSRIDERPIEIRLSHASGTISSSLFQAGQEAGLSDGIIMELVNVFGWDIDFALDIRNGDSFSLVYEQQFIEGDKIRDGRVLAAEFTNQGTSYRAVLYTDPTGESRYYSEDGHSMRKAFLRSPVDFRRISSTFQRERFHPVLGTKRPHRGVDYAAAIGTPIKAAGDGKVLFRGNKGGYGKTIILQHGGQYTTLYAHLSGYRRGIAPGSRVQQGQIIGYVGKTGVATGPHLHYEFRVNGAHRNPLTVKFPDAAPVNAAYRADFETQAKRLLAQLDLFKRVQVASNQN